MKIKRLAAIGVAMALLATGCGSDAGDSSGKKEVTVWMYPVIADATKSQEFWSQAEKDFEAANSTIDLKIELQPWDGRDEKIATAISAGKGPNLVVLGPDQIPQYQKTGGLKELDGLDDKSKFLENAVNAATIDGKTYAAPIYHTITTTAYNKKVFTDAGITKLPTTWDEIKDAAPKLAANGVAVMDYSGSPEVTLNLSYYPLLWQAGGKIFNDDGKTVAFNGAEGKAALQFLVDLQKVKGIPADAATKGNKVEGGGLSTGKTAMGYTLGMADVALMTKALGEGNVEVGAPLTGAKQVTFGLPGLLTRTTIGDDDASANTVAKWMSSADFQAKLSAASGFFPARTDAKVDESNPNTAKFQEALKTARAGEVNPKARQVMAALAPHIQAALQGSKTVDQALGDAEKEANDILAS
ncbi:extracellular solute-binding protein [Propionibacteriaceae bacterium G57]|uniref:extracellular solute-binding protein n=1 Tax=Aestuariimicrobium sp. G57 TaxID=3418485 RepID=UPI003DA6E925